MKENPLVAKRVVELDISLNDFVSMFADQRDFEIHAGMLSGLLQAIVSWEHDDFDWPEHVDKVIGSLEGRDYDIFATLLTCLQESHCQYRRFHSDEHATSQRKIAALKIALADAIRRSMGVVPDSAQGLLSQEEIDQAEQRRQDQADARNLKNAQRDCGW